MTDHLLPQDRLSRRGFLAGTTALGAAALVPRHARAQAKPGGVLTVASSALPPNIEPHMQGLDIFQRRKPLVYENLVWIDYGLEPKPELAERWEQRSPTEYVFHLRRGVRFHDGKRALPRRQGDGRGGREIHVRPGS
jgi:peptide/nickel transport system substrate-binding protein